MIKKLILPLTLAALVGTAACNSDSPEEIQYSASSSVQVTGFSLQANSKVLDSLQNVFFSIDLVKGEIFNADSLPYGTKTNRLIPVISTPSTVSAVTLEYPREGKSDSLVNYLENSTDSIDFSLGPVKLTVKSQSGTVTRTYNIKVNVHAVKPDTLMWRSIEMASLPTSFAAPKAQRAVEFKGKYYCLTTDGSAYCLAATSDPSDPQWATSDITLPFDADVKTLTAAPDMLYMLSTGGELYQGSDFASWTSTGQTWHAITGVYQNRLIGTMEADGAWQIASYPDLKTWEAPKGFPVSGASQMLSYQTQVAFAPQTVLVGGRTAEGTLTSTAWSFDGESWARISRDGYGLPVGLEDMCLVPYDLVEVPSTTWSPVQYPALLLIGGRNAEGAINRTVYMSTDWGMTWRKAPELLALPSDLPPSYGASAFVYSTTMHASRSAMGWESLRLRQLPPQCSPLLPSSSRVSAMPTEWECPAIYIVGGYDYHGQPLNQMWRGVILRYTFRPVV